MKTENEKIFNQGCIETAKYIKESIIQMTRFGLIEMGSSCRLGNELDDLIQDLEKEATVRKIRTVQNDK